VTARVLVYFAMIEVDGVNSMVECRMRGDALEVECIRPMRQSSEDRGEEILLS